MKSDREHPLDGPHPTTQSAYLSKFKTISSPKLGPQNHIAAHFLGRVL